jgi:hypothetical protein
MTCSGPASVALSVKLTRTSAPTRHSVGICMASPVG